MAVSLITLVTPVALLAEGVDRNHGVDAQQFKLIGSPSSRRAWIEIELSGLDAGLQQVALLAEGVDRNVRILLLV